MNKEEWVEVKTSPPLGEVEPKRCGACGKLFIPTWPTMRRCEFCRRMKIPVVGEEVGGRPF